MDRIDLFKRIHRNCSVVEVGTLYGQFAEEIHKACPTLLLTLVDNWEGVFANAEKACMDRFRGNPQVGIFRQHSVTAASLFGQVDMVYIDAAHDYASVTADLEAWYPHVKSGGIFAGHDYELRADVDPKWGPIQVKPAVDDWAKARGLEIFSTQETNCPSWWMVKP